MNKEGTATQQKQTVLQALTPQIVCQLIELLQDKKVEVRHGSLNTILQYTKSQQAKLMFKKTILFEQILKNMFTQQLTKICLSIIIHFSSSKEFAEQLAVMVDPVILALKEWTDLKEELAMFFLLNATKYDIVIEKLITPSKNNKVNQELDTLIGFLQTKVSRKWVIVNIFVNITSLETGRKYVCEQKLYAKFINQLEAYVQSTRVGTLKLLRNCSFEWENENFIYDFLSAEYNLINRIAEFLITMIIIGKISPSTSQAELYQILKCYMKANDKSVKDKQLSLIEKSSKDNILAEIILAIDVILILSNSNFAEKKPPIMQEPLKQIIGLLKFSDLEEEYKDKLEALEIFCFN